MKKKLFIMILAAAAMNINAQLVVDSIGRVGIATDSVKSMFSIGAVGDGDEAINCNAQGKKYGLYLLNETDSQIFSYGTYSLVKNNTWKCYGGRSTARGGGNVTSAQYVIGMGGFAGNAPTAVGLFGGQASSSTILDFGLFFKALNLSTIS